MINSTTFIAAFTGNLDEIDALLGSAIGLVDEDSYNVFDTLQVKEKALICNTLFYCVNWIRELINGYSSQTHNDEMYGKLCSRLRHLLDLEKTLEDYVTVGILN